MTLFGVSATVPTSGLGGVGAGSSVTHWLRGVFGVCVLVGVFVCGRVCVRFFRKG